MTDSVRGRGDAKQVRVCATPGFAALWLCPRLREFKLGHPNLDLSLTTSEQPEFSPDAEFDVLINYGNCQVLGWRSEVLLKDGLTPVCAPGIAAAYARNDPRLLQEQCLLHNESRVVRGHRVTWADWLDAAGIKGVNPCHGLRFSQYQLAAQEAMAEVGVALGHLALLGGALEDGRLVQPFDHVLPTRGHYCLHVRRSAEGLEAVQAFLRWTRGQVAGRRAA